MEEILYIEPVDEINVGSDVLTSLKELLKDLFANIDKYARQSLIVAILFLNLSNASAVDMLNSQSYQETAVEYIIPHTIEQNNAEKALDELGKLDDDWDCYGAPKISWIAISNCRNVVSRLSADVANRIEVLPTEYGGVQIKMSLKNGGIISCDFGDESMSYYVERPEHKTEYYSFIPYSSENLQKLDSYMVL